MIISYGSSLSLALIFLVFPVYNTVILWVILTETECPSMTQNSLCLLFLRRSLTACRFYDILSCISLQTQVPVVFPHFWVLWSDFTAYLFEEAMSLWIQKSMKYNKLIYKHMILSYMFECKNIVYIRECALDI